MKLRAKASGAIAVAAATPVAAARKSRRLIPLDSLGCLTGVAKSTNLCCWMRSMDFLLYVI